VVQRTGLARQGALEAEVTRSLQQRLHYGAVASDEGDIQRPEITAVLDGQRFL
jgi:hypothetical protein